MLQFSYQQAVTEAGCDEAGRGCLAGPVFAAAVILPEGFHHPLLNDSKKVTEVHRNELREYIMEKAICYGIASCDPEEIDKINILKASFMAMHRAVEQLKQQPGLLLIDGNRFIPYPGIRHQCIIKGDSLYASIAAASILAKTSRDSYMLQLHESFPEYGWINNKGYGTVEHRNAIIKYGMTAHHRKTFQCSDPQLGLPLK